MQIVETLAGQQRCTKHVKRFPDVPKDKPVSLSSVSNCRAHTLVSSFIRYEVFSELL